MRFLKKRKENEQWVKLAYTLGISLLLIPFIYVVMSDTLKNLSEAYEKSLVVAEKEEEVNDLRLRHLKLSQDLEYVISDEYVEREAREKFDYVKSGEKVFVVVGLGDGEVKSAEDERALEPSQKPLDDWLTLLFE